MSNYKKHILQLKGNDITNGKISFSFLQEIIGQLTRLAESTLLAYIEGNSKIKRRKTPNWLLKSIDFHLIDIKEGPTILDIEAPLLSENIDSMQISGFHEFKLEEVSALDLSFFAYMQAFENQQESNLLDKNLLKEIINLNKILDSDDAKIIFISNGKKIEVTKNTLSEIKILEEKTPPSSKAKITGKLDVLPHSKSQLEIETAGKKIRAKLSEKIHFNDISELIGEEVSTFGIANFNPAGEITSFEVTTIKKAGTEDDYFRTTPPVVFKEFDLKRVIKKNKYKGSNLDNLLGKWPGDETIDELLEMLK